MILFDFSALMHQAIFSAIKLKHPRKESGKFVTSDFIDLTKYIILENIFNIQNNFPQYKDLVICQDFTYQGNWRSEIYCNYKSFRKKSRDKSEINYNEVFKEINKFLGFLKTSSPFKVVSFKTAEADDIILCLAKEFSKSEPVLIISSDKDMIQAQIYGNVKQYSLFTHKFINPETKKCHDMKNWLVEHVVLGDVCDEVPRIVDEIEFSDEFKKFVSQNNLEISPENFYKINPKDRENILTNFNLSTGFENIFKKERFGMATLKKRINEFGSLEKWLDSNPLLKEHFERNKKLVLADYIPEKIRTGILNEFYQVSSTYNFDEFKTWMHQNHLGNLILEIPASFSTKTKSGFFDF